MSFDLISIAFCLAGGVAIGLQAPLASLMGTRIGVIQSAFIVNAVGSIASGLALLFIGNNFKNLNQVPWYALCAGILGVVVISVTNIVIPNIGAASAFSIIIAGQLIAGMVIDRYGFFGTDVRHLNINCLLGLILISGGAWLILRR